MRLSIAFWMLMATASAAADANNRTNTATGFQRVCAETQTQCTDGPRVQEIDGMRITRSCWQRTTQYGCVEPNASDTCQAPRERGCREVGAQCQEYATVDGTTLCMTEQREHVCPTGGGETSTVTDCAGQQYCIDGNCFDTGTAPDGDFKKAVSALEMAREAGVYLDQDNLRIFRGEDRRCAKTVARNCCKSARSNVDKLSNRAVQGGSPHTYDVLSGSGVPSTLAAGIDPLGYALEASRDTVAEMLQCDKEEVLTALRRRKGLCHHVGEYCSKKIRLGLASICIEHKETHCCFNSKIARLIAEAAREQLPGLDWGTPKAPACQGISVEQFQQLDLSRIDFREIYDDIRPATASADAGQRYHYPRSYFDLRQDKP
ncbi:conjugal transfer protein TraN [Pseudoduganella umbonata]|nr:conjugal transfer protein TraN [Pseudoduganella umbonata]MBB3221716.1 conjugal transfer mating pair stabilization protein TraN [Pseudoduganella umbonata]